MALVDQIIRLRFTQGVDTEADEKGLPPGKLTRLENAVFDKAITLEKRPGHEALSNKYGADLAVVSGGLDVWSDGEVLYRHDGRRVVWSYNSTGDWSPVNFMRSPTVNHQKVLKSSTERYNGEITVTGSIALAAWEEADGVHMAVLDPTNDWQPIYGPDLVASGATKPRVAVAGTQLHMYCVLTSSQIGISVINPYDLYSSWDNYTLNELTSDLDTRATRSLAYDVIPHDGAVALIYPSSAPDVKIAYVAPIGVIASTGSANSRPDPVTASFGQIDAGPAAAISPQGYLSVFAWKTGSGVEYLSLDASTFVRKNSSTIDSTVTTANGDTVVRITAECEPERYVGSAEPTRDSRAVCWYEVTSSAGSRVRAVGRDTTLSSSITARNVVFRAKIAGRPYGLDADTYCPVMNTEPTQQTVFLVDTSGRPYAKLLPGLASPLQSGTVPGWTRHPDGSDAIVLGARDQVPTAFDAQGNPTGSMAFSDRCLSLATFDWRASASLDWATKDGYVFVGGGQVHMLDGGSAVEVGFHVNPEGSTCTPTGGSSHTAGTYLYSPVYEWTDSKGYRHLGTGEAISCTLTASGDVDVMVPTPQFTLKGRSVVFNNSNGPVRIAMFRTKVNGSVFYRADSPTKPIVLSSTASFHTYRDNVADSALGEIDPRTAFVENVAPPAARHVAVVKDRVMLAGIAGAPNEVWYSKVGQDADGPAFSDERIFVVSSQGGPITGLGEIDDKGIVFKRDRVLAFNGSAPSDLVVDSAAFTDAQIVGTDAGCVDSRTICPVQGTRAQGLVFKSRKGIKLLDRGLNTTDIGAPVADHVGLDIGRILREPGTDRVRVLTRDGLTLVYDSRWDQWSTYTGLQGNGACVWDDRYALVGDDGVVLVSTTGSQDAGIPYPMLAETGWITFVGLQDYARVRSLHILGNYHSPHTLHVDVAYDYRGYSERHEIPSSRLIRGTTYGSGSYGSGSYGGATDSVYQARIDLKRQRCQSIRLRFRDELGSDGGASFSLTEVALTVAIDKGQARLPGRKRSG